MQRPELLVTKETPQLWQSHPGAGRNPIFRHIPGERLQLGGVLSHCGHGLLRLLSLLCDNDWGRNLCPLGPEHHAALGAAEYVALTSIQLFHLWSKNMEHILNRKCWAVSYLASWIFFIFLTAASFHFVTFEDTLSAAFCASLRSVVRPSTGLALNLPVLGDFNWTWAGSGLLDWFSGSRVSGCTTSCWEFMGETPTWDWLLIWLSRDRDDDVDGAGDSELDGSSSGIWRLLDPSREETLDGGLNCFLLAELIISMTFSKRDLLPLQSFLWAGYETL